MKRALYIGKFQPFHIGHQNVARQIVVAPDIDEIIVAVGSAQWNWRFPNPQASLLDNIFTFEERREMIYSSLFDLGKKITVVPIFDYLPKWREDTVIDWFEGIKNACPQFHCVYTNNKMEQAFFAGKGYCVRPFFRNFYFSASDIRRKMAREEMWMPFVGQATERIVRLSDGENRAKKLYQSLVVPCDCEDHYWEWRTFENISEKTLSLFSSLPLFKFESIKDFYLISFANSSINFKLRHDKIKFKKLLAMNGEYELWTEFNGSLPVEKEKFVRGCSSFGLPINFNLPEIVDEKGLLKNISRKPNPYLFLSVLDKERHMRLFEKQNCRCGIDLSYFNLFGRRVCTIGLEAREKKHLDIALKELDMVCSKQRNYVQYLEEEYTEKTDVWKNF